MTEPCMSNDTGHYQGLYSERKECGVIGAYAFLWFMPVVRHKNNNDHSDSNTN
ncbi:hypothetical protein [Vibrio mediterranei]|uniref:hypothetical protein n=1 Tax=Vibrio mediterranei TaxID=689 RepID=UPI001551FF0F|nr:hypothetical protein [Vibrio mediterranei]